MEKNIYIVCVHIKTVYVKLYYIYIYVYIYIYTHIVYVKLNHFGLQQKLNATLYINYTLIKFKNVCVGEQKVGTVE